MDIGSNIRSIRNKKKITIAELSEGTGLSKGFISNIENNNTSPSINTLETIAKFLDVPLTYFLMEKEDRLQVTKKDDREVTISQQGKMRVENIARRGGLRLQSVTLEPGCSIDEKPHAHQGIECHVVMKGKILVEQVEDSVVLEEGDSFSWNASVPHMVTNIGEDTAIVIIAIYSE